MDAYRHNSLRGGTLGSPGILVCSSAPGSHRTLFRCLSVMSFNVSGRPNFDELHWQLLSMIGPNYSRRIYHELTMGTKLKRSCWRVLYFTGSVF